MRYVISACLFSLLLTINCSKLFSPKNHIVKQSLIYESDNKISFPNMTKLFSGDLLCVFQGNSNSPDSNSSILLSRSSNNGSSWTIPDTIIHTQFNCHQPYITEMRDGSLLLNFYQSFVDSTNQKTGSVGVFVTRSFDGGQTWFPPKMVIMEEYDWAITTCNILELKNGSLLLPIYAGTKDGKHTMLVSASTDLGRTWNEKIIVYHDSTGMKNFTNSALLQLPDGRILNMMSTAEENHQLFQSYSDDMGKTWSAPQNTRIQGQDPALLLTKDNILVCAFQDFSPNGMSYCSSYDYGLTYEKEHIIAPTTTPGSSPSLALLEKDRLVCVFSNNSGLNNQIAADFFQVLPPLSPNGIRASVQKDTTIKLRWNRVDNAHYYLVFREEQSDSTGLVSQDFNGLLYSQTDKTWILDNDISADKTYRYQIVTVSSYSELVENSGAKSPPATSDFIGVKE